MKTKGFTLVELLVVIAILAILATVSVVGYTSFIERAEDSNAETELHQIETTIQSYTIAQQEYVIATDGDVEYVVYVEDDGDVVVRTLTTKDDPATDADETVWTNLTTEVMAKATFEWTDFEEVKAGFTVTNGVLSYKELPVNLKD